MPKKKAKTAPSEPPVEPQQPRVIQKEFFLRFTPESQQDLKDIDDRRIVKDLLLRCNALKHEPLAQGKPLVGRLKTYRSVRAIGQRYRIIYQVALYQEQVIILIIGLRKQGDKKDVYRRAERRISG